MDRHVVMQAGFSRELLALITLADVSIPFDCVQIARIMVYKLTEEPKYNHLFVQFLGWFESTRDIFFAMEYIEYGDLSTYMTTDGEKAREEAPEITSQILQGLDILHREGICHRDLKPQV